jgi:uncharacterized membrane protein YfcA
LLVYIVAFAAALVLSTVASPAGGYLGAFAQPQLPQTLVRWVLGLLAIAIAVRYAWLAAHPCGSLLQSGQAGA